MPRQLDKYGNKTTMNKEKILKIIIFILMPIATRVGSKTCHRNKRRGSKNYN